MQITPSTLYMPKHLLILLAITLLSSSLAFAKAGPRFDGIYKVGKVGDYQVTYIKLHPDGKFQSLRNVKNDDIAAIRKLNDGEGDDGWRYQWSKKSINLSKRTGSLSLSGRYFLTRDGLIENSEFLLLDENNTIIQVIKTSTPIRIPRKYAIYDLSGKKLGSGFESIRGLPASQNFLVQQEDQYQLIDNAGNALTPRMDRMQLINNYRIGLATYIQGLGWGILDHNGNVLQENQFLSITLKGDNTFGLGKDGQWTLIDSPLKHVPLKDTKPTTKTISKDDKWGVISLEDNSYLILNEYRYVRETSGSMYIATPFSGKYKSLVFDETGKQIFQSKHPILDMVSPELAIFGKGKYQGLINLSSGKVIIKPRLTNMMFVNGALTGIEH